MRRISKLNFTTTPIVRPRIVEVSDDVMLGSPRETYSPSPPRHPYIIPVLPVKRGLTMEEEDEEKDDDEGDVSVFSEFVKSRRGSTSVSPADHHTEHGIVKRRPLHQQRYMVKPGPSISIKDSRAEHYHQHHHHHHRPSTSSAGAGAGVKVVQRVETKTSVLSDGSTRNKVWRQSAAVDGTWVVSEEEEYVTKENENKNMSSSIKNILEDPQIWKGCKYVAWLILVFLLLVMVWLYGFYFVDFVKWSIFGGWSVVANGAAHLVAVFQREQQQRMEGVHHDPVSEQRNFANSNPPGLFDESAILSLQQAILGLKMKLENVEQIVEKHESRLISQDEHLKLLESEIRRAIIIITDTKEAFNNEKTVDQIIEQVLAVPLGETEEGDLVTLRSLFSVLEDKGKQERIARDETEAKIWSVAKRLGKAEEYFGGVDNGLANLKTDLRELEAKVEGFGNVKDSAGDKEQIERVILPLIVTQVEKQIVASSVLKMNGNGGDVPFSGLTIKDVQWMITRALSKYDADKTGLPDLALETAGGSILSVRNTKAPKLRNAVITSFWGFRLWAWAPPNTPRTIIQPGVVPGECWSFEGSVGNVVIKLAVPSIITGFSLEHIPKAISRHGHISSAPKQFQVLGLTDVQDTEQTHDFGVFTYEDKNESLQYFSVLNLTSKTYPIVELKVLSNQGNVKHTCLYRFRVHGEAADQDGEMKPDSGSEEK
ncbi:unnamed protein product [Orchesella dallaii]|uniref:SUN domain-containing protein n=1 Tax=Orchesella dallaii TaxID=48710 RepID=A0ABP1S8B4_9HEXA